ncbi:OmpA/MotB domain-containing protein [Candidatus Nitrosoglobus terrae]|uniref:OmpA/MotB domain-containing protein n=1 Tax=Candidatus Nitrosoglobus terrae TaxID=1630141 RepID=A0A1Q2SP88_9GAMM|nr:OmpA family protein [Candidatus Nitrosoglobus terrae]BAW80909.1 OmpA/MotB domain-containing protein [Candidatus Nitrosoglobus terrae]
MNHKNTIVYTIVIVLILFTTTHSLDSLAQSEVENRPLYAPHRNWPPCAVMEANGENALNGQVITWTICRSTPFKATTLDSDHDSTPAAATMLDSDHDGILDDADQCPSTPASTTVDEIGCPLDDDPPDNTDLCTNTNEAGCSLDSDHDGILDDADQCPDTPINTKVDETGCPLDSDQDGILDSSDRCPDTPSGTTVDKNGCPAPIVLKGVNFEPDSTHLTVGAQEILTKIADSLRSHPNLDITIKGHTDNLGSADYNKSLSQSRAKSVMGYLASNGIMQSRMRAIGYGEEHPITSNVTEKGRARNRRVELQASENQ